MSSAPTMQGISQRQRNNALVLEIETSNGSRFFCDFNIRGAVQTAWSLAGARLFLDEPENLEHQEFSRIKRRLDRAGKTWRVVNVTIDNFELSQSGGVGARYGVSPIGGGIAQTEAWFTHLGEAKDYANERNPVREVWDLVEGERVQ